MQDEVTTRTVISALPNWHVAVYAAADHRPHTFVLDPIIAWEITREEIDDGYRLMNQISHRVMPLTLEGDLEQAGNIWAIKRSDGKFKFLRDECTFDNEAEALDYARDRQAAEEERRNKPRSVVS